MTALLHPSYFPSIVSLSVIVNAGHILLEAADNFQKQTYRNRMYIYGANGRLILQVPIKHTKADGHQLYKDVRVENAFPWQARHWKSLETAYRSSPYFEYYEDALRPLFVEQHSSLLDLKYHRQPTCTEGNLNCLYQQVFLLHQESIPDTHYL